MGSAAPSLVGLIVMACADSGLPQPCQSCFIELDHVATIGTEGGAGALSAAPSSIAQNSRGYYFVTVPWSGDDAPYVYDSLGMYHFQLGAVGDGPGEYRQPWIVVVDQQDSIFVFDRGNARLSVLSPELQVVRTISGVPHVTDATLLTTGVLAVNVGSYTGYPLALLDRDGSLLKSFGEHPSPMQRGDEYLRIWRRLAPGRDGSLWSANVYFNYSLTLWDSAGQTSIVLGGAPSWFQPYENFAGASPDTPPLPVVTGLFEDELGRIWVLGQLADENWSDGLGAQMTYQGQSYYPVEDPVRVFDGVIMVIDPQSGSTLAERRFDELAQLIAVRPNSVGSVRTSDDGWISIDIYHGTLRERRF